MRLRLLSCAALLSALPAQGSISMPSPAAIDALSPIDAAPTQAAIDNAFAGQALDSLQLIVRDRTMDLGVVLRAIRALPSYCPKPCVSGSVRDTLVSLIIEAKSQHTPQDLLRLRASIESLGVTRSVTDFNILTPLLTHPSRDIRASAARALLNICNVAAKDDLKKSYDAEMITQVKNEMSAALQALDGQCPN